VNITGPADEATTEPQPWWRRLVHRIPPKAWFAIAAAILALAGLVFYPAASRTPATLNVILRHNFRSAELSVLIDGRVAFTQQVSGSVKKRFGILDKRAEGEFSKTLSVSAGEHVVQIHVRSAAEGVDQTKQVGVNLLPKSDATVAISAQRSGMSVSYQGPPVAPVQDNANGLYSTVRSIALTIFGSAVSATIGFMVQEFLRSKKSARETERQKSTAAR